MTKVLDVRDTERANIFLSNFQQTTCKVSHLMAMKRFLDKGNGLPEGVDVFRPAVYIDDPDTIRVLHYV